jgi:hypothetical protein
MSSIKKRSVEFMSFIIFLSAEPITSKLKGISTPDCVFSVARQMPVGKFGLLGLEQAMTEHKPTIIK